MKVTKSNLETLEKKHKGYIKGAAVSEFFKDFGIRFAAGHWCAGDFLDRFATDGYAEEGTSDSGILAQMERVAAAEIEGIEFHDTVFLNTDFKPDKEIIAAVKKQLKRLKLVPTNMNINLFTHPRWRLGGLTNPNRVVRAAALRNALQAVEIADAVGCRSVALWPGSDGWDYNFESDYGEMLNMFVNGCAAINRKAKSYGLRFGIEAKLKEPREGNMVISTTTKAMLVARTVNEACGGKNMGVAIDYGHEMMYGVEPADMLYTAKRFGVPITNFHLNNAKYRSNDEDRVTGTGDNWALADFCYAAIVTGYDGWFGEDQFTYRQNPVKAMSLSREIFANVMKKALLIYKRRDALKKSQSSGDSSAVIDVVKDILI
ncbi:MAG: sugar phosphate isomerase/epimerase family protein [bacterium]